MMDIVPYQKQGTFSDCFILFFWKSFLKTRIFTDVQFSQKVEVSLVLSFHTNFDLSQNPIFLKHFPHPSTSEYAKKEKQWS